MVGAVGNLVPRGVPIQSDLAYFTMEDGWTVILSELNTVKNNAIIDSNEENCMSSNMCLWHLILYNALIYISLYYFANLFIRTLAYDYTCST